MRRTAASVILLASPSVFAGAGDAYLSLIVETANGDDIVTPDEGAAFLTVWCTMVDNPDDQFHLWAFGGCLFNIFGDENRGEVATYTILNGLADLDPPGDTTQIEGDDLLNISVLQVPFFDYVDDNPIALIRFEWRPTDPQDYGPLTYRTDLSPSHGVIGVFGSHPKGLPSVNYTGHDGAVTFRYIPEPAAALILATLATPRRRRRSP